MIFTYLAISFAVVLFALGFGALLTRVVSDDDHELVREHAKTLFQASLSVSAIAALFRWLGLCLALFLVGCTSTLDRALDKAEELDAKNAVVVCVEKPTFTECAVSGDNFEGVFTLRCSWFWCSEVPPLTK